MHQDIFLEGARPA